MWFTFLQVAGTIDSRITSRYNLTIRVDDGQSPNSRFSLKTLEVVVNSKNEHSPSFSKNSYEATLSELLPVGSFVANVVATDKDRGLPGRIQYRLVGFAAKA